MLPSHGMEVAPGASFGPVLGMTLAALSTGPLCTEHSFKPSPAASMQHLDTQEGAALVGVTFFLRYSRGTTLYPEGCDQGRRLRATMGFLVPLGIWGTSDTCLRASALKPCLIHLLWR